MARIKVNDSCNLCTGDESQAYRRGNRTLVATSHNERYGYYLNANERYVYQWNAPEQKWCGWLCSIEAWERTYSKAEWMKLQ